MDEVLAELEDRPSQFIGPESDGRCDLDLIVAERSGDFCLLLRILALRWLDIVIQMLLS